VLAASLRQLLSWASGGLPDFSRDRDLRNSPPRLIPISATNSSNSSLARCRNSTSSITSPINYSGILEEAVARLHGLGREARQCLLV
jgi:hypothetical protein